MLLEVKELLRYILRARYFYHGGANHANAYYGLVGQADIGGSTTKVTDCSQALCMTRHKIGH